MAKLKPEFQAMLDAHKPKRKHVSTKTRFDVFKRDGFACQYCGAVPPKVLLHVDHIVAVANGGTSDTDNLVTACENCNLGKGARPLSKVPQALSERTADVAEREAQIAGYAEVMAARKQRIEDDAWEVAEVLTPGAKDGYDRKRFHSVKMFVERIGFVETLEAAEIADARCYSDGPKFRYFCGVCWNKIRKNEEDA